MLRTVLALACLVFTAPSFAQDETNVVVFLKSPYYAKVEHSLTGTGERNIDPSWCLPGANFAKFPWAEEFGLVGRGNNPMPLVHAIMSDSDGRCGYFTVYTSMLAVPPDLGKKLAEWVPALTSAHKAQSSVVVEKPRTPSLAATAGLPPPPAIPVMQPAQQGKDGEEQTPLPRPKPPIIVVKKNSTPPKPKEPALSLTPAEAGISRVPLARSIQSH